MAKIMVVDDESETVGLISFILQRDGHTVVPLYDGKSCLDRVHSDRPDLIILDIMMPIMDGYSVYTSLEANEETSRIPILVLTAKGGMKEAFSLARNVVHCMEKPFNPNVLRAEVNKILSQQQGR